MATVLDVPADALISRVAEELKKNEATKAPEWAKLVKTGSHRQRAPQQPDWWYTRCASILRTIKINGPIGVQKLRTKYGGRKNRGSKPQKHVDAGGKIIRTCLQQLDTAGYTEKKPKGRTTTPKGESFLDKLATDIKKSLEKINPQLAKY